MTRQAAGPSDISKAEAAPTHPRIRIKVRWGTKATPRHLHWSSEVHKHTHRMTPTASTYTIIFEGCKVSIWICFAWYENSFGRRYIIRRAGLRVILDYRFMVPIAHTTTTCIRLLKIVIRCSLFEMNIQIGFTTGHGAPQKRCYQCLRKHRTTPRGRKTVTKADGTPLLHNPGNVSGIH